MADSNITLWSADLPGTVIVYLRDSQPNAAVVIVSLFGVGLLLTWLLGLIMKPRQVDNQDTCGQLREEMNERLEALRENILNKQSRLKHRLYETEQAATALAMDRLTNSNGLTQPYQTELGNFVEYMRDQNEFTSSDGSQ